MDDSSNPFSIRLLPGNPQRLPGDPSAPHAAVLDRQRGGAAAIAPVAADRDPAVLPGENGHLTTLWFAGALGRPVLLRPIRPDDADALADFIQRQSPLSRLRRFHSPLREASPALLRMLTRPDPATDLALVVIGWDAGAPRIVAEARFVADAQAGAAQREFALAVADDRQRQGLGRRLLRTLIAQAARRGVQRLFGDVLRDNLPMQRLAEREGFAVRTHPEDARLLRVVRRLEAVAGLAGAAHAPREPRFAPAAVEVP